jgi:hypothetical protein
MSENTPLDRFKRFVSEILTVSKEDVQKAEADRRAVYPPPKPPVNDGEDESPD